MTETRANPVASPSSSAPTADRGVDEIVVVDGVQVPVQRKVVKVSRNDALAVKIAYLARLDLGETPPAWMKTVVDALEEPHPGTGADDPGPTTVTFLGDRFGSPVTVNGRSFTVPNIVGRAGEVVSVNDPRIRPLKRRGQL